MRQDSVQFARASRASSKRPRYVVKIEFDVGSIYCTSHNDILSVPGVVLDGVLQEPSAVSQRLIPDEGRSEIGAFSCQLVDLGGQFTDEIRAKLLEDGVGIRKKKVVFYEGFEGFDFSAFQVVTTQIVQYTSYENGVYTVQCADITREQRQSIFEPKFTTLRDNVTDSATTIPVYNTTGFEMIAHGTSWSDAPSATAGYIKIENEIIRYTGKTADSFTGCTRGALNTKAVAHSVDANASAERRTKVEEYIYIELPAVKLAWAVLTGQLYGSSNTLPDHWHLGVDPSLIRESDFTGIGTDLWDPNDDTAALILRFEGLKKTDGKRFLEKEIYLLLGCYSPVYSDGALGLKRLPALLGDSAPVVTLTEDNITSLGELRHDEDGMHNVFRINWNYDPAKDEFTRITYFTDAESVAIHGAADVKEYSFKGLHGSRHTDAIVRQRLNALRDAYAHPPERISVSVLGSLSYLEMGDVVRLNVANVRDYAGQSSSIDRAFVILQKRHNAARNEVTLDLFGSTARPLATPPGDPDFESASLPDAFYTSAGSNLNTVATITSNVMATGNYTITGNASIKNSAAIYYHDGDLTIPAGCNLTITGNVQLRIKGFLTLNGTINGTGGGKAGVSDPGVQITSPIQGNPGYVGHSRGWDGLDWESTARGVFAGLFVRATSIPAALTRGQHDAFPLLSLSVSGSSLLGLPDDLRGTGGGPGGQIIDDAGNVQSAGGTGAAGGAGLCIICRGMAIGTVGNITLNGANPAPTSVVGAGVFSLYPGVGGAGGPGALLILLDGNTLSIPDITGKFVATTGTVTQLGSPIPSRTFQLDVHNPVVSGFADPAVISAQDWSNAAHRIQYIPEPQVATPDVDLRPPAPTAMQLTSTGEAITARITAQFVDPRDAVELWASADNNRSNAVRVGFGRVTEFTVELPVLTGRYFWTRMRRDYADRPDVFSDWLPSSATGGIFASTLNPGGWTPVATNGGGATMIVRANEIQKSGGVSDWDSQVYSRESYASGCALSFRPLQTNANFMIGLNTDPTTDASYTSLDYAWLVRDDAFLQCYENGALVVSNAGTYDTSTTLSITYDGAYVRYLRNGTEVRKVPRIGERFHLDSSFYTPGAAAAAIQFVPLAPAPNTLALVARGNCVTQGNAITKVGGSFAWDSDCYSLAAYAACAMSFRPGNTAQYMLGLNSDPTTDQGYTSLDHAWYVDGGGMLNIYESGSPAVVGVSGFNPSTLLAITYDGQWVEYLKDGTVVRRVWNPGKTFFLDSSFLTPGATALDVTFGPLSGATPDPYIARGNCKVSGTNIQKVGGSAVWGDSDCYSIVGYPVCHLAFKANETNTARMIGLNSDPTTDINYTSIDFAWYARDDGRVLIYESGSLIADLGTYTTSTLLAITYDGSNVRYYKDDLTTPVRTVSAPGLTLFMDSAFNTPGAGVNSLDFGPGTQLAVIDTPQIGDNAATEIVSSQPVDGTVTVPSVSNGGSTLVSHLTITSVSWTNSTTQSIDVEVRYAALVALTASDAIVGRNLNLRWTFDGSSFDDDRGTASILITAVDPSYQSRASQRIITVPAGSTLTAYVDIAVVIPPFASGDPADVRYKGTSISIVAIKK